MGRSPLALVKLIGVLVMPSISSVLARNAVWDPRLVVRITTLSDFSGVLPIVLSAIVPATGALRLLRFWCSTVSAVSGPTRLGPGYFANIDWVRLNAGAELKAQALIMIRVRQSVFRIIMARVDEVYRGFVMKRGEILSAVVVVRLHEFLPFPDYVVHSGCLLLLATALLPYLGIRRESAGCCGVLN